MSNIYDLNCIFNLGEDHSSSSHNIDDGEVVADLILLPLKSTNRNERIYLPNRKFRSISKSTLSSLYEPEPKKTAVEELLDLDNYSFNKKKCRFNESTIGSKHRFKSNSSGRLSERKFTQNVVTQVLLNSGSVSYNTSRYMCSHHQKIMKNKENGSPSTSRASIASKSQDKDYTKPEKNISRKSILKDLLNTSKAKSSHLNCTCNDQQQQNKPDNDNKASCKCQKCKENLVQHLLKLGNDRLSSIHNITLEKLKERNLKKKSMLNKLSPKHSLDSNNEKLNTKETVIKDNTRLCSLYKEIGELKLELLQSQVVELKDKRKRDCEIHQLKTTVLLMDIELKKKQLAEYENHF